jgi:alpha-glucosidase
LKDEAAIVAINTSEKAVSIELPLWQLGLSAKSLHNILDDREVIDYKNSLSINLPAESGKIWRLK